MKREENISHHFEDHMKNSLIIHFLLKNSPFFNSQLETKPLGKFFFINFNMEFFSINQLLTINVL